MAQRTKELAGNHNCFGSVASADRRATLIICAVVGSNIQWQWTPNQYLASGIGVGLAFLATVIVNELRDRRGRRKPHQ
jgi:hypothetical protein